MSRNGLAMAEITPEGHHRAVAEPERIERILSAMSMWSMAPAPGAGADGPWKERATIHVEILAWANDVNAWTLRRRRCLALGAAVKSGFPGPVSRTAR
jgi:hypothetical protein